MTEPASPKPLQTLILWAVIARGGRSLQGTLKPQPGKADREALVALRLIEARKDGRSWVLDVTDAGWAWAAGNTGATLPSNTNNGTAVLREMLSRLGAYLAATGVPLAELIAPRPAASAPHDSLPDRIRGAYFAETGGEAGRRARLTALRRRLSDVPRPALDAMLLDLARSTGVLLMPLENPAELTPDDAAGALSQGGRAVHLLLMER